MSSQPDLRAIIRPNVLAMKRYTSTTMDEEHTRPKTLLDANENSLGSCLVSGDQPEMGSDDLRTEFQFYKSLELHRYPSMSMVDLKKKIVAFRGLEESAIEKVTLGVGAADIIDLLMRVTCVPSEDAILVTPPTFPLYSIRAALNDVTVFQSKLRAAEDDFLPDVSEIQSILSENGNIKLVFLASPGNPTGSLVSLHDIQRILTHPGLNGLVVVDEAYIDFALDSERKSAVQLLDQFPNLAVVQTLSKSHGMAGVRLGWVFAHEFITEMLKKAQMPFSISTPTAALASKALSPPYEQAHKGAMVKMVENREWLIDALNRPEFAGVSIGPPIGGNAGNFVLLPVWALEDAGRVHDCARAQWACQVLESEYSLGVRYVGNAPGSDSCIRITVGTAAENAKLVRDMIQVFRRG